MDHFYPLVNNNTLKWNYDNFLTRKKQQQTDATRTVLDMNTLSPEEMEQRFLSDTTPDDMMPF